MELLPIGERVKTRPNLMQLTADVNQWDSDVIGLVDPSYMRETVLSTKEHNVNIEFAQTAA
jgi:hypothetical protein